MKVVFTKDLSGVAKKGDVREFSDGYAKNFLVAKGYAVAASDQMLAQIRNEQKQQEAKKQKDLERAKKAKHELDKRTFTLVVKVGDKGQVYGSVNEKELLSKIKDKTNLELDRHQLVMPKHLKSLGEYEVEVKLGNNLTAHPKIKLVDHAE